MIQPKSPRAAQSVALRLFSPWTMQPSLFSFALLSLTLIAMTSCHTTPPVGVVLRAQGHVAHVLGGQPPEEEDWVDLAPFKAAFEAGSTASVASIGEFISFNGVGYARSTGIDSMGEMISGKRVITNGAVFLPEDAVPDFVLDVTEPKEIAALVESIESRAGGPVCYIGTVQFSPLHATAITRAPIYSDYIFEAKEKYYAEPPTESPLVNAAIMGCAANLERCRVAGLDAVLYANPAEPAGGITSHTHALELSCELESAKDVTVESAEQVHHVFSKSVVASGRIEVYLIGEIRPL